MKNRKLFIIFTILLLAVATTFCGFVVAKYIREKQTDVVVTSKNFFFTVSTTPYLRKEAGFGQA